MGLSANTGGQAVDVAFGFFARRAFARDIEVALEQRERGRRLIQEVGAQHPEVVQRLGALKGISPEEMRAHIGENAKRLFGLK